MSVGSSENASINAPEKEQPESQAMHVSDPPDGGMNAYLQVVGAFFLFLNSWYSSPHFP